MDVIQDISPKDDMFQGNKDHYFHVGESALENIMSALSATNKPADEIKDILDLPCGFGQVLRSLKTSFPNANLFACDFLKDGVDFCAKTFGATPIYSSKNIASITISGTFDLIWVGSLFTHLDKDDWSKFLELFSRILKPGGLLLITFHGPTVIQNIESAQNTYGLPPEAAKDLLTQYSQYQYAYVNYPGNIGYGISISSPANTLDIIERLSSLKVISYKEKAWDNHQDVLCCQKEGQFSDRIAEEENHEDKTNLQVTKDKLASQVMKRALSPGGKPNVIFCLPEGLTLGGVTTWSVELSRGLSGAGFSTFLGIHPSRYNNPPVDFGITAEDQIIDCMHLPHPDDPKLNARDYISPYQKALPGILIPSWSWGTYAMAALFASNRPELLRVIGMAHSDESGYYQWLVHYEAMIHKFIVANTEIQRKLVQMIPHRREDVLVKSAPVSVPEEFAHTYSPPGQPLQIIYGGRIAQYQKRIFDLLDLIKLLFDEGVNFRFRIIGGGTDKDEFYKKVNQLPGKLRQLVNLEESVPLAQLTQIWRSTDINVMVSDFEGVSNSMLMGMAEGCVPVMTEVSGTSEVITSGVDGVLVPVGDMAQMARAIKKIDLDRNLLVELGKNAHRKVDADYSASKYLSWFTDIINQIWEEPPRPWPPKTPPMAFENIHRRFVQMSKSTTDTPGLNAFPKKNVLFLSHDPNWGGAPKVMYSLIKGLDKRKWNPIVVLPDHGSLESKLNNIGVKTFITPMHNITTDVQKYWQQYTLFNDTLPERAGRVADIITQEQVDLVVTNTICIFEGALAAKLACVPHVWYVHELSSQDDQLTPLLDYETFYASIDSLSDKVVVISKAVQSEINQFYPSKKIELIYTGLEPIEYESAPDKQKILGIDPDTPVITCIGVISKRKGVLSLIDTANIVTQKFPRVKFVIAGRKEGETFVKLQKQIVEHSLENNFQFLGFRDDVQEIIACSDIVVVPSIIEPFSLVSIEAMQGGKPVVATRSGGPEEFIVDGENGILVPVNDPSEMAKAIIQLLENSEIRIAIGEKGLSCFNERFAYKGYISHFDQLFDRVIAIPQQNTENNQLIVENFIRLAGVATQAKTDLASLGQKIDPLQTVNELLNYPSYTPFDLAPRDYLGHQPKVSICVPVYNGSEYIRECIDSVLAQSFNNFELIIVNDASTDASKKIIQTYTDPRIKYFENEHNLGLVGNWNRCLMLSSGEFIGIFHQDDVMTPTNLEEKVSILDNEASVGFVYSDALIINQKGKHTSEHWFNLIDPNIDFIRPGSSFFDLMFENLNIVSCPSVLARRECYERIGGFDQRLPFSVDMEMWMRIALFYDVAYLSKPLIKYRYHESNQTRGFLDLDLIHVYLCKRMLLEKYPSMLGDSYNNILVRDTSRRVFERSVHHYHIGQYNTARQYLYFLEKIRSSIQEKEIMDIQIKQLMSYVNQSNAIDWITGVDRVNKKSSNLYRKNVHYDPIRRAYLSRFVDIVKPYVPLFLKNRLKGLKRKLLR